MAYEKKANNYYFPPRIKFDGEWVTFVDYQECKLIISVAEQEGRKAPNAEKLIAAFDSYMTECMSARLAEKERGLADARFKTLIDRLNAIPVSVMKTSKRSAAKAMKEMRHVFI